MKKKDKKYVEELKEYLEKAEARLKYSLERFDILIISLSSGGLVLGCTLFERFPEAEKSLINIAWIFFSSALIINLISQITGYLANKYDIKCTNNIIYELEGKCMEGNQKTIEFVQNLCNILTNWLNIFSFICLSTGIVLLTIFINTKT